MRKTLHYSIMCVLMLLSYLPAMAQDVTIDFRTETPNAPVDYVFTHTSQGFTFTATKETGFSNPRYFSSAQDMRLYGNNKLVITSDTPFTKIVFNISTKGLDQWADLTPDQGETFKADKASKTATWTAPSPVNRLEITVGDQNAHGNKRGSKARAGQFFFNSVTITKANETTEVIASPQFSHSTGNYFTAFELTLTAPDGYTIYYTTDLSTPSNTNGNRFTAPIPIANSTTIRAIAYNQAEKKSFVVDHIFTFPAIRSNIEAIKQMGNNETAKLKLTDAYVLAAGNGNMFVQDASGAIMFYKTGLNYAPGTKLNGEIICNFMRYEGLPEVIKAGDDTNGNNITATPDGTPAAMPIALSDIKNDNMLCKLVQISGVTLDSVNNKLYAVVGEERIEVYNKTLGAISSSTVLQNQSTNNTLTAIVSIHKGNYQLLPVTLEGLTTGIHEVVAETENAAKTAIYNLAGQRVDANYKGVVVKNGKKYLQK